MRNTEVVFDCKKCGFRLVAPVIKEGNTIRCLSCSAVIEIEVSIELREPQIGDD